MRWTSWILLAGVAAAGYVYAQRVAAAGPRPAPAAFDGMDADDDGFITRAEHAEAARAMFAAMDEDDDGELTRSEWAAGHARLMRKSGAG